MSFISQKVFQDSEANVLCDMILDLIDNEFSITPSPLLLTGGAARMMQGDPNAPVRCVSFITNNQTVFDFCRDDLPMIVKARGSVSYTNQVRIVFSDKIFIEVFFGTATPVTVGTIEMQEKSNIPPYIE